MDEIRLEHEDDVVEQVLQKELEELEELVPKRQKERKTKKWSPVNRQTDRFQ